MNTSILLSSGYKCPVLGLGTYLATDPEKLENAIKFAIGKCGYRHIDTAYVYDNEEIIGKALKNLFDNDVVKREDLFITTKLSSTMHRPDMVIPAIKNQLKALQLDYVDLYLIHNPRSFKFVSEKNHFPKGIEF